MEKLKDTALEMVLSVGQEDSRRYKRSDDGNKIVKI